MSVKKSKTEHCKEESGYIWECDLRQNIHMVAAAELLSRAYVCHQGTKYISLYKHTRGTWQIYFADDNLLQFIVISLLSHTFATQIIWQIPQERCDKANYFICFTNIHMKRGAILCRPIHCTGLAFKRFVFFANKTSSHLIKLHGYYPSQSFVGWVTNRATSAPHMVGDNPVVRGHTGVGVN